MIRGSVIHGDGVGKGLGYPTANVNMSTAQTKLKPGVYAATAHLFGVLYYAALVIHEFKDKIEVHFIDYSGPDFYGEIITVEAVQKISTLERLDSIEELKEKIGADVDMVREFFAQKK